MTKLVLLVIASTVVMSCTPWPTTVTGKVTCKTTTIFYHNATDPSTIDSIVTVIDSLSCPK